VKSVQPRWMALGATIWMIGCSAVLGLDEPTHRIDGGTQGAEIAPDVNSDTMHFRRPSLLVPRWFSLSLSMHLDAVIELQQRSE
jgi:hypothetical protein